MYRNATQAALEAGQWVGLKLNTPKSKLQEVLDTLPALRKPTIAPLSDENWVAVETIIEDKVVREIIPELRDNGAEGITNIHSTKSSINCAL